jgi:hypothetical protein
MTKTTRFDIRLRGAFAAALFLGLAHPALAWDQPQWVRQLGTSETDAASGVATDGKGSVYIAGSTTGSLGGASRGNDDAWLAKYSAAGALRWKRQLGTAALDVADGVAVDGDGNLYISGSTAGSLGGPFQGGFDAWVAKYSAAGALRWKRQLGTSGLDVAWASAAADGDGNVYIAGWTDGSLGGPFQGGDRDAWVAKYSAAGELLWKRQFGTSDLDVALGVATGDGNVYISGFTGGSLWAPNRGGFDAWVVKYSAVGDLLWKRQFGTAESDGANAVATNGDGNVYVSGSTAGSLGGPNRGSNDAWVAKYSAAGDLLWKRQLGTARDEIALGVAADGDTNVYTGGSTFGSLGGPNRGNDDAWVAKYSTGP